MLQELSVPSSNVVVGAVITLLIRVLEIPGFYWPGVLFPIFRRVCKISKSDY